jgi:hypothetical protein
MHTATVQMTVPASAAIGERAVSVSQKFRKLVSQAK